MSTAIVKDTAIDEVIALYMVRRGINKAKLIRLTGIKQSTFYLMMRDKSYLSLYALRKIYDALQVPNDERRGL